MWELMEIKCLPTINYSSRLKAKWQPPPHGWVKANIDAAIDDIGWIRVGVVLRDEGGIIIAVLMARLRRLSNAFVGEVLAIKEGLCLIRS